MENREKSSRKTYLDNLRLVTVALVVVYHVFYMFNSVMPDGVIGALWDRQPQDVLLYLLYPWFMVIFFLISGMCARYYLQTHSGREFLRARTKKLLIPSTVGLFVFWWLQGWINMAISHAFEQIPEAVPIPVLYIIMALSGTGVLWTMQLLWLFSLLLLAVRRMEKDRLYPKFEKMNCVGLVLLGILVWCSAQMFNLPIVSVYRFGIYGFSFLIGYYVLSHEAVMDCLVKYRFVLAVAAAVLGIVYAVRYFGQNYAVEPAVSCLPAISYGWIACLALLGMFKAYANRTCAFLEWMRKKSFGLYVCHYLPLSAAAYFLTQKASVGGIGCFVLTFLAAFAGGLLLAGILSRIPVISGLTLGVWREKDVLR